MWWFGKQIKSYRYLEHTIDIFELKGWYKWYVDTELMLWTIWKKKSDLERIDCWLRCYIAWYEAGKLKEDEETEQDLY